jgi:hypothetical protein
MSVLPYLPPGQADLPAERFLLFVDTTNQVQVFDESEKLGDGVAFDGHWTTATLNRGEKAYEEFTLIAFRLYYSAEDDTTVTLNVSGDGGNTWSETKQLSISGTQNEIRRAAKGFNTTGYDLRVQIVFDTEVLVKIFGFRPTLVPAGAIGHE